MQSIAFSLLAVAATLSASVRAAPTPNTQNANAVEARGAYYVCYNNGFRGDCSVDPCAISWCPDYKPYTYELLSAGGSSTTPTTPAPPVSPPVVPAATQFYTCYNNGFRGQCSVDPCAIAWCPDYKPYTYDPVTAAAAAKRADPTVCAPGTGFFQSCSNGFRGCCKTDACGPAGWCPDYKFGSYTPVGATTAPEVVTPKVETPAPVTSTPATIVVAADANGVCPPNTGYYQVCASGFKGCCKKDACSVGYCSA